MWRRSSGSGHIRGPRPPVSDDARSDPCARIATDSLPWHRAAYDTAVPHSLGLAVRRHLPEPVDRVLRQARRRWWRICDRVAPPTSQPTRPAVRATPVRLLIGPANFAGQAWEWSRAVERELPSVSATAMSVRRAGLEFASDYAVPMTDRAGGALLSVVGSRRTSRTSSSTRCVR